MGAGGGRPIVLVVDDDEAVRQTLQAILETDFDVLDVVDGSSALEMVRVAPVDLVLLDVVLPDVDGLTVLDQLQAVRPGIRVVMISGVNQAAPAATAIRHGAIDYVTKPFDVQALLKAVHGALHQRPGFRAAPGTMVPAGVALIGCSVNLVAGVAAALAPGIDVHGYVDPLSPETVAGRGVPSVIVVDADRRPTSWLSRAALLPATLPSAKAVVLAHENSPEIRFMFGERYIAAKRPLQVTRLLDLICAALPALPASQPWRESRTAAVMDAVAADYVGFKLDQLADRLGVSPHYLSRRFGIDTKMLLGTFINRVRVYAARHLLEHDSPKLDVLAAAVGFHDASHLSQNFLRIVGYRPGQHRTRLGHEGDGRSGDRD